MNGNCIRISGSHVIIEQLHFHDTPPTRHPDRVKSIFRMGAIFNMHGAHHNVPPIRRQKMVVLALDRLTGKTIWQREVRDELPHESIHETGSWASASPVTDGEVVIASFGSHGIYALGLDGEKLWESDLGDMTTKLAFGKLDQW